MVELCEFAAVKTKNAVVYHASNLDVLPLMADNSVDSIVCDPPYELGFMGKAWDSTGIAYSVELWRECLRVLKPGGHLLAFSGSRTYHRQVVAIEDAGFEIRDMISWISNKTFPKSHNIGKAIDKALGAERDVIGSGTAGAGFAKGRGFGLNTIQTGEATTEWDVTAPATDEAKQWDGWGTALKPTVEPVVLARKPVDGSVADNVLAWGVGGLNIDASRIGTEEITINTFDNGAKPFGDAVGEPYTSKQVQGRWPANVVFDEACAELLDEQSGQSKSPKTYVRKADGFGQTSYALGQSVGTESVNYGDAGGASRFFYVARASKADRNDGVEANTHPTVKPTDLMRYLIKLVTPAGGVVLDPFTGSGSTGKAALLDGYRFVGIEMTADYLPIIEGRLLWAEAEAQRVTQAAAEEESIRLF
jgi:site-specific DNA-methyltransferase (adenine-specific)